MREPRGLRMRLLLGQFRFPWFRHHPAHADRYGITRRKRLLYAVIERGLGRLLLDGPRFCRVVWMTPGSWKRESGGISHDEPPTLGIRMDKEWLRTLHPAP